MKTEIPSGIKRLFFLPVALTGFAAIVSQIVCARELLTVFYGNELSCAFILATWLIAGATGSALFGRISDRTGSGAGIFVACQLILSIVLPLTVAAIKSVKSVTGMNPGEIMPFFPMIISSLLVLLPSCAILGFMFAAGCRIFKDFSGREGHGAGKVYITEAIGSAAGGLLTSFVLLKLFGPFQIMACLGLSLAIAAAATATLTAGSKNRLKYLSASAVFIFLEAAALASGVWPRLDAYLAARQWHGYEVVASGSSIYGNIAVTKSSSQYSFFNNGLHLYSVPDRRASEEAVHFAMLEHRGPENVLLIGGGVGGLAGEILRYPVKRLDYVEIDPLMIRMAEKFLPGSYYAPLEDRRVFLHFADGRAYVKNADISYDVIIVALGDPYTAQLNRFYTLEFFEETRKILKRGGILSFGLSSSESYMSRESRDFLGSIYRTLVLSFPDVLVIPGETAYFIASDGTGSLTYDHAAITDMAYAKGLDLKYVRDYYLSSRLSEENISFVRKSLADTSRQGVNSDFKPISYYFDMVFWSARFKDSFFTKALRRTDSGIVLSVAGAAALALTVLGVWLGSREGGFRSLSVMVVAANGFSQIVSQVVILLSFQIIYGYVYYKLGFIMTSFMIGLAIGGYRAIRAIPKTDNMGHRVVAAQLCMCLYPVILLQAIRLASASSSDGGSWIGSNIVFTMLPLISGFTGGYIFTLASKIFLDGRDGSSAGKSGGLIYGIDLIGSCVGALVAGTFLVPIIGIPGTCFVMAGINGAVLAGLAISRDRNICGLRR